MKMRFPDSNKQAVDLMEKLLQFDPRKRPTAEEALRHPWLASLHDEAEENVATGNSDRTSPDKSLEESYAGDV